MSSAAARNLVMDEDSPTPKPRKRKPKAVKEVNLFEGLPTGTPVDGLPNPSELAEAVKSPYPKGIQCFSYQPKAGGDPILLAVTGFKSPDKLWHFDNAQLPMLAQRWAWLDYAKIPKDIQRRLHTLPDPEFFEVFNEWFRVMAKLRQAPEGAVTPGK